MDRLFPQFNGNLTQLGRNDSEIYYDSLQINYNMRFRGGLNVLGNYTLSKQIEKWGFNDPYNNVYQRGLYFLDRPQVLKATVVYELPFGQGKKWGANANRFTKKLISVFDWGAAQYFRPLLTHLPVGQAIALCLIADPSREALTLLANDMGGRIVFERAAGGDAVDIPPLYEFTWNHTTLWALKADRTITYLQCLFDGPDYLDKIARAVAAFGDETPMHLEFTRVDGRIAAFGLQLVRFTSEQRLYEIIAWLEAAGCPVADPHTFILEDGGMKTIDEAQLAFKRQNDPLGLLNPGKMKAFNPPTCPVAGRPA